MAISNANATKINRMNRAADNVDLGTLVQSLQTYVATLQTNATVSGSIAINSTHTNGSVVTINPGLGANKGYIVQLSRSGSMLTGSGVFVTNSSGSLSVSVTGAGWVMTIGDSINWIAW